MDDEETPLGNMDVEDAKEGLPLAGMIALLAGCVAALAGLMILLVRLKKHSKKNDAAR